MPSMSHVIPTAYMSPSLSRNNCLYIVLVLSPYAAPRRVQVLRFNWRGLFERFRLFGRRSFGDVELMELSIFESRFSGYVQNRPFMQGVCVNAIRLVQS